MRIKYVATTQYECEVNEGNTIFQFQVAVPTEDVGRVAAKKEVRPVNAVVEAMVEHWRKTPIGRTKPYSDIDAKAEAQAIANARLMKDGDLFYEDGEWKQR